MLEIPSHSTGIILHGITRIKATAHSHFCMVEWTCQRDREKANLVCGAKVTNPIQSEDDMHAMETHSCLLLRTVPGTHIHCDYDD